jgi:hypothetical protein
VIVKLAGSETPASEGDKATLRENSSNQAIISGRILTQDQSPVIGANIIIKGTTTGTISDMQGDFRLMVNKDCPTLVISYIGMETKSLENLCEGKDLQIILTKPSVNTVSPDPGLSTPQVVNTPESMDLKVFPNPSSEVVNISFQLEKEAIIKLSVYTLDGKLIKTLVHQKLDAGVQQFTWKAGAEVKGTFAVLLETTEKVVQKQVVIE